MTIPEHTVRQESYRRTPMENTMTIPEQKSTTAAEPLSIDAQLEVAVVPVSDADRAKHFYPSLGWREDADFPIGEDCRVLQFTPS